jgi:hypothetical protein
METIVSKKKIKSQGALKPSRKGTTHLPKNIRDELGDKIEYIVDAKTALLFNPDTSPEDILASLEVLKKDLKLRIEEG